MKRIGVLIISLLASVFTYADNSSKLDEALRHFNHYLSLYDKGKYEEAMQGFNDCKRRYSAELDIASLNGWIGKCNQKIAAKKAATERKAAEAKLAEERRIAAKKLAAEKAEKARLDSLRIANKLLFVSSNAFLINEKYEGMRYAIKGYIADNSRYKFTEDQNLAYWGIYVTATARKHAVVEGGDGRKKYTTRVVAHLKIVNEIIKETIYEGEIERSRVSNNHEAAAQDAYKIINKDIALEILKQLK